MSFKQKGIKSTTLPLPSSIFTLGCLFLTKGKRLSPLRQLSKLVLADESCQLHKTFLNVGVVLNRGGEVLDLVLTAPLHNFSFAYSSFQVTLIAQQHNNSLVSLGPAQIVPLFLYVLEGSLAGEVEHHENPVASLEVGGNDGTVFFLAGSIPDVKFRRPVLQGDVFHLKINGGHLSILFSQEITLSEPPEEGSFPYVAIADDDYLVLFLVFVH